MFITQSHSPYQRGPLELPYNEDKIAHTEFSKEDNVVPVNLP